MQLCGTASTDALQYERSPPLVLSSKLCQLCPLLLLLLLLLLLQLKAS
jgi:hypothetical protein